MDYILLVGFIGMFMILCAFALNVLQKMKSTSLSYLTLNFYGSALLVLYAVFLRSLPFILLNMVWMFATFYEYWHIHHKKTRKHRY